MLEHQDELLYEIDEKGQRVLVRSMESSQRAFIRFNNKTSRPVNIWWRDYEGARRFFTCLEPGTSYDVSTYITHPWEFTDAYTKEVYVINNYPVYRPPPNIGGMMYRTNWNITVTVRTLRDTALLKLATIIRNPNTVERLELPRLLVEDLKTLVVTIRTRPTPPPSRD